MKTSIVLILLILTAPAGPGYAGGESSGKKDAGSTILPETELVDIPTAGILDYYGFLSKTRFFSGGGMLESLGFGVLQRLNMGASIDIERLIGSDSSVRVVRPEIQVKYRFYDGGSYIPAMAAGYDGQGYFFDKNLKKYMEKSRGVFIAGSQEIKLPGMLLHGGVNISDFDSNNVYGFTGLSYSIQESALLMLEWDNIHKIKNSRINTGMRIFITPFFHLDFSLRGIGRGGCHENGALRRPERIVQLRYNSNF